MKFPTTDIATFQDAFAEDTATFFGQSFTVDLHKIYITAGVAGEQVESKEWTALVLNSDLAALSPAVAHDSSLAIGSRTFRVDGIQEDDPTEGFTRLILTEA